MPKDSTIFGKPFLRFMFSQYYRNDLLKTQQPRTVFTVRTLYSIKNCILCDKVSMQAQLPVNIREMISTLPTRERRSKARLLPNRYDLQFLQVRIICCMGKETKMWNVNLQLLLHLWIQLQSLEAWKRTMSISVTKWRWPYQVLKARLHSFN